MQIKKIAKTKKTIILAGIVLLALSVGYLGVAAAYKAYPFQERPVLETDKKKVNQVNYDEATEEEKNAPTEMTEAGSTNRPNETGNDVNIAITSSQVDASGDLRISTVIQALSNEGQCTLLLKRGEQEVEIQHVGVQALSNASTCKGFTVAANKLASGKYTVVVTYNYGDKKGSVQREVELP